MFAGLASPSHLIIVLVVVLPGEDAAEAGAPESEKVRSEKPHDGSGDGTVRTVGAHAGQRGL